MSDKLCQKDYFDLAYSSCPYTIIGSQKIAQFLGIWGIRQAYIIRLIYRVVTN